MLIIIIIETLIIVWLLYYMYNAIKFEKSEEEYKANIQKRYEILEKEYLKLCDEIKGEDK